MRNVQEATLSFIGTGWSFPPRFSKAAGDLIMVSDIDDIIESLSILLSTSMGERIMVPSYGSNLQDFIFEPMGQSMLSFIENLIYEAILYHEPRISLNKVTLDTSSYVEGKLLIEIDFTVSSTNSRYNYVYPFYINEGSSLK